MAPLLRADKCKLVMLRNRLNGRGRQMPAKPNLGHVLLVAEAVH